MTFGLSPGITTQEIDLTTGAIQAVSTSIGAIAGAFNWGPTLQINTVSVETQLNSMFGTPDANTANSYLTAAQFLSYSSTLRVVRCLGANGKNATANGSGQVIMNSDDYFNNVYSTTSTNSYTARNIGSLGNSLEVITFANAAVWTAVSSNVNHPLYNFANQFDYAPTTTPYVSTVTNGAVTGDEMHIVVIDVNGLITGQANTVLETFPSVSRLTNSVGADGSSNYYKNVLFQNSDWIYRTGVPSSNTSGWDITIAAANGTNLQANAESSANIAFLTGGSDGTISDANVITGMALFSNRDSVDIDLLMCHGGDATIIDAAAALAMTRQDIVVTASPSLAATQDPTSPANAINTFVNTLTRTSYLFIDSGWKYTYDKYNDVYRWIPLNGDTAGLMARTDATNATWWSPAGLQRGQINNVVKLAYNPDESDRDDLYQNGVNPVVSFPGQGTLLYGDKTFINFSSVFSRINVRRLFIFLEKTLRIAARAQLFEFNDMFTRAQFVNLVTPFLRTVKAGRGVTDFDVICDTTNNTSDIIAADEFIGDIYIIPNYSINWIKLRFVAVPAGVSFSTAVGTVAGSGS